MSHTEPLQLRTIASVLDQMVHARDESDLKELGAWVANDVKPNERTVKFLRACYECRQEELKPKGE